MGELLVAVKAYLEEATKTHSVLQGSETSLNDRVYTWTANDSELRGLLHRILDATECSRRLDIENASISSPVSTLSDQCPRILQIMNPVTVGPATTISLPEASFTSDGRAQRRRRISTIATIFSQDNVTEITWQANLDRLEAAGDPRHSPVGSDVSRLSPSTNRSSNETLRESRMPESQTGAGGPIDSSLCIQDKPSTRQRSSMVVMTSADDTNQQAASEVEQAEENESYLSRFRKKSVQFGHAIGSFMNGDFRNADHKPRRESTVVRLRTALDRIEPSRPNQDAAIFGAFTGARPIDVVSQYHARRPGPPSNTCSEDGR
ncbi:hypothetical protein N0V82_002232 [Gnomoniopsis sp. IMI 355080]|nr:hypothetical protein N0V82_002232 [Gnomoniopsis sp. IMI 355080]